MTPACSFCRFAVLPVALGSPLRPPLPPSALGGCRGRLPPGALPFFCRATDFSALTITRRHSVEQRL